ncbi:Winged helix-turn-helix transcription repressor DNA-binding [Penicillium frequentans]|nr:Winged helix-turn-helix transcription repressor DNA-binding [Penicillium glabrum]
MADRSSPRTSSRDSEEDQPADPPSTDPPYSQLIYQALRETKGHRLQLQDIYTWFEKNTNKGKDESKGWQNSIRHNLSMNAGFEAIRTDVPGGKKAVNYWSLTTQAISKGRVESTTRYRRPNPKKSSSENTAPLSTSQRGSAKVQKSWDESRQAKRQKHHPTPKSPSQQLGYALGGEPGPPCQIPEPTGSQQIYPYAFDYDRVVACTPLQGNSPMFCDSVNPAPSWGPGPVRMENYEWYSGPNNGAFAGSEDQVTTDMHGHVKEERWG